MAEVAEHQQKATQSQCTGPNMAHANPKDARGPQGCGQAHEQAVASTEQIQSYPSPHSCLGFSDVAVLLMLLSAERLDDAHIQERFRVLGIELQQGIGRFLAQ